MLRVDRISKGGNNYKTTKQDGIQNRKNRMIVVQMWGGKHLCNAVWQGCDDLTGDWMRWSHMILWPHDQARHQ
jgi:hypothetical protein